VKDQYFEFLIDLYQSARINNAFFKGSGMELSPGKCKIRLEVRPEHHHGMDAIHGAVYFKLLDDAAYFAAQTVEKTFYIVTTGFNIHLLRPVSEGLLLAEGSVRLASPHLLMADAVLYNAQGKEVAYGTGHFAMSKLKLPNL